jgi:hypothetical protein
MMRTASTLTRADALGKSSECGLYTCRLPPARCARGAAGALTAPRAQYDHPRSHHLRFTAVHTATHGTCQAPHRDTEDTSRESAPGCMHRASRRGTGSDRDRSPFRQRETRERPRERDDRTHTGAWTVHDAASSLAPPRDRAKAASAICSCCAPTSKAISPSAIAAPMAATGGGVGRHARPAVPLARDMCR